MATSSARSKKISPLQKTVQITMQDPVNGTMHLDSFTIPSGSNGDPFHLIGEEALWDAQEKAYDAMEARSAKEQKKLAKEALALSMDCADAYVILSTHASTLKEKIRLCKEGVKAGERVLGAKNIKKYKGMFWGIFETRPYMRAKTQLADYLFKAGKYIEAIVHYQELLELNPNDNKGIRYILLPYFLETQQLKEAEILWNQYKDDACTIWTYGLALLLFQKHGPTIKANNALRKAIKTNHYIPSYLLGIRAIPDQLPESYALGSEEEALCFIDPILTAFMHTDGATEWLRTQFEKFSKKN